MDGWEVLDKFILKGFGNSFESYGSCQIVQIILEVRKVFAYGWIFCGFKTKFAVTILFIFVLFIEKEGLLMVSTDDYNKLLQDTSYHICQIPQIQRQHPKRDQLEAKVIAEHLELDDKIEILPEQQAFLSLNNLKPNFQNHPKCRLMIPLKSNLGKVSKQLLDNINSAVRESTKLQQWQNTSAVITWFNNLPNKQRCKFLTF